jgi:thiamine biosynthesis lipoprotein
MQIRQQHFMSESASSRRDFLNGRIILDAAERAASRSGIDAGPNVPSRGPTLLLRTTAMACDFDVMLNPGGPPSQLEAASSALDLVHELEQRLSVYRSDSELSEINRAAFLEPVSASTEVFELLVRAQRLSELTEHAFDPAAGALIKLWRDCRQEFRIPVTEEIDAVLARSGVSHVRFDPAEQRVAFLREGIEFNLGAIGKGYAVDRAGEVLLSRDVGNWLVHGGRSSIRAQGMHAGHDGWPVGLQNPLLPDRLFATVLLKNAALATSGTAVQWFRHEGRRYGHILDPRTGWPDETLLSVSVIAPDSAMADALSTAFFVLGVEKSLVCCDNLPGSVRAVFFPLPKQGQGLEPILHNISAKSWFAA